MFDVFEYLERASGEDTFYLKPLNLMFVEQNIEQELAVFLDLAAKLAAQPEVYAKLINDDNWRSHLVAYTCLVVSNNKTHLEDLKALLDRGSMVSPQIVVALFRLFRFDVNVRDWLLDFFATREGREYSSTKGAILALASRLAKPEITLPHGNVIADPFMLGADVARQHESFWNTHLGLR